VIVHWAKASYRKVAGRSLPKVQASTFNKMDLRSANLVAKFVDEVFLEWINFVVTHPVKGALSKSEKAILNAGTGDESSLYSQWLFEFLVQYSEDESHPDNQQQLKSLS